MNVCVCGWYYEPQFMRFLRSVHKRGYPVTVVGNRPWAERNGAPYEYHVRENRGLEFGAYDYYLKHIWDGGDTLFMHDDINVKPIIQGHELVNPVFIFDKIAQFEDDIVFIFKSDQSRLKNIDMHGRAFFASEAFLKDLLATNNGFDWDENNDGHIQGPPPAYCHNYNWAITKLREYLWTKKLVGVKATVSYIPSFDYFVRGERRT